MGFLMDENLVSIEELAKLLGVSTATINYYTNLGLFKVTDRRGNARLYQKEITKKLYDQIRQLRKQGYSLRVIQERLDKGYSI